MRYSSSTRLINVVLFGLLFAGFAFLGIWFGIIVAPYVVIGKGSPLGESMPSITLGLSVMLASIGIGAGLVALLGLVTSIRALLKQNDDQLVVRSFGCYIALGYVLAIIAFLNASWLYRLTTSNYGFTDIAFGIIVFAILTIVLLIATNVPFVKIFGEDNTPSRSMRVITSAFAAANLGAAIPFGITYIVTKGNGTFTNSSIYGLKLGMFTLIPLVAALLAIVAYLGYAKAEKAGTISKVNGFLFEGSLAVMGIAIIVAGVFEQIYADSKVSFVGPNKSSSPADFPVMSYIVGGLIVLIALVLVYYTLFPNRIKIREEK